MKAGHASHSTSRGLVGYTCLTPSVTPDSIHSALPWARLVALGVSPPLLLDLVIAFTEHGLWRAGTSQWPREWLRVQGLIPSHAMLLLGYSVADNPVPNSSLILCVTRDGASGILHAKQVLYN